MTKDKEEEKEIKTKLNRNKSEKYICYVLQPFGVKELDAEKTNFEEVRSFIDYFKTVWDNAKIVLD